MKVIERKTNLVGEATQIVEEGKVKYEVAIENQEVKVIAESTFKKNYKVVEDTKGVNEKMEENKNEQVIIEEIPAEEEIAVDVEEVLVEGDTEEVVVERQATENKEKELEVVLTEAQELEIKQAVSDLSNVITALPIMKVKIEKNSRNTKVELYPVKMQITLGYENDLMDYIVEDLKKEISENIELEYINQQKRSNPAAFKARGVKVTDAEGNVDYYNCRNDAMIWITAKYEKGELDKKPTYYQVKKAIEAGGGEYLGYTWQEWDTTTEETEEITAQ